MTYLSFHTEYWSNLKLLIITALTPPPAPR